MSSPFPQHECLLAALTHILTVCQFPQEKLENVGKSRGHDKKSDAITNTAQDCSVSWFNSVKLLTLHCIKMRLYLMKIYVWRHTNKIQLAPDHMADDPYGQNKKLIHGKIHLSRLDLTLVCFLLLGCVMVTLVSMASDWSSQITWPQYWPLIGQDETEQDPMLRPGTRLSTFWSILFMNSVTFSVTGYLVDPKSKWRFALR